MYEYGHGEMNERAEDGEGGGGKQDIETINTIQEFANTNHLKTNNIFS